MKKAILKFWGVRGSLPTGGSEYGSHTSCVEFDFGNETSLFFDAGTGIQAATVNRRFKKIFLCLSHFHWDHIQGLPYLNRIEEPGFELEVFSAFEDTLDRLSVLFDPRFHPVSFAQIKSRLKLKIMKPGETVNIANGVLDLAPLNHPGRSFAFRFATPTHSLVYATDSDYEEMHPDAEKLLKRADIAIMDSQFLVGDSIAKAHYGHSSFKKTIDTAMRFGIRNPYLFHFDPQYTDEDLKKLESQATAYFKDAYPNTSSQFQMAKEGLTCEVFL